jgi:predicted RNase H-like HicB family nuclease
MKREFKSVIRAAPEGGYWATCIDVAGANGQGETTTEAENNLGQAIKLILDSNLSSSELPRAMAKSKIHISRSASVIRKRSGRKSGTNGSAGMRAEKPMGIRIENIDAVQTPVRLRALINRIGQSVDRLPIAARNTG